MAAQVRQQAAGLLDAVRPLWLDQEGVSSIEYAFLLSVLVVGTVVAFGHLSDEVRIIAGKSSRTLEQAAGMGCYSGR